MEENGQHKKTEEEGEASFVLVYTRWRRAERGFYLEAYAHDRVTCRVGVFLYR